MPPCPSLLPGHIATSQQLLSLGIPIASKDGDIRGFLQWDEKKPFHHLKLDHFGHFGIETKVLCIPHFMKPPMGIFMDIFTAFYWGTMVNMNMIIFDVNSQIHGQSAVAFQSDNILFLSAYQPFWSAAGRSCPRPNHHAS